MSPDFSIPCPHEGDWQACERCWASHADAVPYCSDNYGRGRATQLGERMAATMALIDRAIASARQLVPSRVAAGIAPVLPRGVPVRVRMDCDRCGCRSDVTEDEGTEDGALCGDCRWELGHPEQCPEPSGAGRCGAHKDATADRCDECERRVYEEE